MARHEDRDLERRLSSDAEEVRAVVSPELQSRIRASVHSARQLQSAPAGRNAGGRYWWASALTGVAAVLLVIVIVEWNRDVPDGLPAEPTAATAPEIIEFFGVLPLKARTADLTGPLEDELLHLQSDLEKARLSVERDLRSAL
jgi:hypothetical protein